MRNLLLLFCLMAATAVAQITTIGGGGNGSVSSVSGSGPTWLTWSVATATTTPAITLSATTGQTSHQVIGTCGSATTFGPCSLVAGDIPTLNQDTTGTAAGLSGSQTANFFYAAPNGSAGAALWRAIVAADVPILNQSTTGTAANVTGIVAEASGGTGANNTVGSAGHVLRSNGTHYVDSAIQAADVPTLNQNTTGTAANLSGTPALPNGTTATTQSQADNSTKVATTAYVDTGLATKAASIETVNAQSTTYSTATTDCGNVVKSTNSGNTTITMTTSGFSTGCVIRYVNNGTGIVTLAPASGNIQASNSTLSNYFLGLNGSVTMVFDGTNFVAYGPASQVLCDSGYTAFVNSSTNILSTDAGNYFGVTGTTAATSYTNFAIGQCTLPANLITNNTIIVGEFQGHLVTSASSPNAVIGLKMGTTALTATTASVAFTSSLGTHGIRGSFEINGTAAAGSAAGVIATCVGPRDIGGLGCTNTANGTTNLATNGSLTTNIGMLWAAATAANAVGLDRVTWTLLRQ